MFLHEITHRYLKNDYQFFDTLETKDCKIRRNYNLLIKVKFHKLGFVHLSVYLSIYLSIYLSVCLSVYLYIRRYTYIHCAPLVFKTGESALVKHYGKRHKHYINTTYRCTKDV